MFDHVTFNRLEILENLKLKSKAISVDIERCIANIDFLESRVQEYNSQIKVNLLDENFGLAKEFDIEIEKMEKRIKSLQNQLSNIKHQHKTVGLCIQKLKSAKFCMNNSIIGEIVLLLSEPPYKECILVW